MNRTVVSVAILSAAISAAATARPAAGSVIGATVADASSGNYTLTSVTVERGGTAGTFTYLPSQLIGVDVTDVAATGSSLAVQHNASVPAAGTRATLLEDGRLDTGLINPFSTSSPVTDAFEVTFVTPIVNSDGADVIVFDIGTGDPTAFWVNGDRTNARHDVTAANFTTGLLSGVPFTQYAYINPAGGTNVNGLADLEATSGWDGTASNGTTAIAAVSLDLSDLGIAVGGTVSTLGWQTTSTGSRLDAVYVAGLPAVPEPTGFAAVALVAAAATLRRRRRPRA
jgi:hypothetical protein